MDSATAPQCETYSHPAGGGHTLTSWVDTAQHLQSVHITPFYLRTKKYSRDIRFCLFPDRHDELMLQVKELNVYVWIKPYDTNTDLSRLKKNVITTLILSNLIESLITFLEETT